MRKILAIASVILLSGLIFLQGCGASSSNKTKEKERPVLTSGKFYIKHGDEFISPYFPNTTFKRNSSNTSPNSNGRVAWFKDDFKKIPTFYSGDTLIMYSSSTFEPKFTFERFKDTGYSFGFCDLRKTGTNRCQLNIADNSSALYPGGDTDKLRELSTDTCILEAIDGVPLRFNTADDDMLSYITESGTIKSLEEGQVYTVDVYEGTIHHAYKFLVDTRILVSFQGKQTNDFEYNPEGYIEIPIPEWFNDGYYMINGQGMFRYVKGIDYDENTDFNVINVDPENAKINSSDLNSTAGDEGTRYQLDDDLVSYTFDVNGVGNIVIKTILTKVNANAVSSNSISGVVMTPSGESINMTNKNGVMECSFTAEQTGTYTLVYRNAKGYEVNIHIN